MSISFPPRPSVKEGRLDIIQLLRFIDEGVVGTFNKYMEQEDKEDLKIDMRPFKSDFIEQLGSAPAEGSKPIRVVTYRIRRAVPAALTGGTRDRKYRLREEVHEATDFNDLGTPEVNEIYGKWEDYTIRFDCFAPSWKEAQELFLDFQHLMDVCIPYITSKGITKFVYEGRTADVYYMKTDYFYEPCTFLARVEWLKVVKGETLRELFVEFDNALMNIVK